LNGFWKQIQDYLPGVIRRAGLTSIVKITDSAVYFKDGDDRWRVRTDNKQVTKLDKDQIAMIDWN
jgi:cation diffusion facilitator CzcD-associated flavoprotein CzcO